MVNWWLSWVSILTSETERRSWACACEREHICVWQWQREKARRYAAAGRLTVTAAPACSLSLSPPAGEQTNQPNLRRLAGQEINLNLNQQNQTEIYWIRQDQLPLNQDRKETQMCPLFSPSESSSAILHGERIDMRPWNQDPRFFCLNLMPLQENRKNSSRKEKNQNQHAWNLKEKKKISSRLLLRSYSSK